MKDTISAKQRLKPIKQAQKGFTKSALYLILAFYLWAVLFGVLLYTIN